MPTQLLKVATTAVCTAVLCWLAVPAAQVWGQGGERSSLGVRVGAYAPLNSISSPELERAWIDPAVSIGVSATKQVAHGFAVRGLAEVAPGTRSGVRARDEVCSSSGTDCKSLGPRSTIAFLLLDAVAGSGSWFAAAGVGGRGFIGTMSCALGDAACLAHMDYPEHGIAPAGHLALGVSTCGLGRDLVIELGDYPTREWSHTQHQLSLTIGMLW